MLLALLPTAVIISALAFGFRSRRRGDIIGEHGFNNQYSDATGARRDHVG